MLCAIKQCHFNYRVNRICTGRIIEELERESVNGFAHLLILWNSPDVSFPNGVTVIKVGNTLPYLLQQWSALSLNVNLKSPDMMKATNRKYR